MTSVEGPDHSSNLREAGIDGEEMGVFGRELVFTDSWYGMRHSHLGQEAVQKWLIHQRK